MPEIKRRKPQPRCKCGHAKNRHYHIVALPVGFTGETACGYCYEQCTEFRYDALATWEKLYEYNQTKHLSV